MIFRGNTGGALCGIRPVAGRIKNPDIAGNLAVSSNGDFLTNREMTSVTNSGVVSDDECGLVREAGGERERRLSVDPNIVADNQIASADEEMKVGACMYVSAVARAIRFKEGFAYKDAEAEFVGRAQCEENSQQWSCNKTRNGGQSEIKDRSAARLAGIAGANDSTGQGFDES